MSSILALDIVGDGASAARALDSVGDSATRMASEVDSATRDASTAAGRLDTIGESAGDMASKSSQAAGGIGDLGGALSLMPGPLGKVGAGMEALGPAIMGVTGASDLLELATKANIVQTTRSRVATLAKAGAERVGAVATKGMALAQRALNIAMRANPIGLLITGLILVGTLLVVAYKKSETFRNIVQGVMRGVSAAVGWVIDKAQALVGWVKDRVPGAFRSMKDTASSVIGGVKGFFSGLLSPIQNVIDKVQSLIGWIKDIHFPKIPDLNPFNGKASSGSRPYVTRSAGALPATGGTTVNYYVTVQGAVDPIATARQIRQILSRADRQLTGA